MVIMAMLATHSDPRPMTSNMEPSSGAEVIP